MSQQNEKLSLPAQLPEGQDDSAWAAYQVLSALWGIYATKEQARVLNWFYEKAQGKRRALVQLFPIAVSDLLGSSKQIPSISDAPEACHRFFGGKECRAGAYFGGQEHCRCGLVKGHPGECLCGACGYREDETPLVACVHCAEAISPCPLPNETDPSLCRGWIHVNGGHHCHRYTLELAEPSTIQNVDSPQ